MESYFDATKSILPRISLQKKMSLVFKDISLADRRMLDIGGGDGLFSFYAACMGAREVVCLDPEGDGSQSRYSKRFQQLNTALSGQVKVRMVNTTFQEFPAAGQVFDVILLHNAINHLDEEACIRLRHDEDALQIYRGLFARLFKLSAADARLIICDASNLNFFALLGLSNPFAPSIEWEKHQEPSVWVKLLEEAGFIQPQILWSSFPILSGLKALLLRNRLAAFLTTSHFCIWMQKA